MDNRIRTKKGQTKTPPTLVKRRERQHTSAGGETTAIETPKTVEHTKEEASPSRTLGRKCQEKEQEKRYLTLKLLEAGLSIYCLDTTFCEFDPFLVQQLS